MRSIGRLVFPGFVDLLSQAGGALAPAIQCGTRDVGLKSVLALLWVTAAIAISATLLFFVLGALLIASTRNLIVHAPTQF